MADSDETNADEPTASAGNLREWKKRLQERRRKMPELHDVADLDRVNWMQVVYGRARPAQGGNDPGQREHIGNLFTRTKRTQPNPASNAFDVSRSLPARQDWTSPQVRIGPPLPLPFSG